MSRENRNNRHGCCINILLSVGALPMILFIFHAVISKCRSVSGKYRGRGSMRPKLFRLCRRINNRISASSCLFRVKRIFLLFSRKEIVVILCIIWTYIPSFRDHPAVFVLIHIDSADIISVIIVIYVVCAGITRYLSHFLSPPQHILYRQQRRILYRRRNRLLRRKGRDLSVLPNRDHPRVIS